jgi:hypothetical protein
MPKYVFECQTDGCNLKFERSMKMSDDHRSHVCPSCKEVAPGVIEGFAFDFKSGSAATPGNTGVHKDDYPTADHAVGKDADKRWSYYQAREQVKTAARTQGDTPALIRRTGTDYVEYEPMTDVGRDARRKLTKKALGRVQAAKESRGTR